MLHGIRLAEGSDGLQRQEVRSWLLKEPPEDPQGEEDSSFWGNDGSSAGIELPLLVSALKEAASFFKTREFAISVPLSQTLVRMFRFPVESQGDIAETIDAEFEKTSPFPDEVLQIGKETILETDKEILVLAAAYPMKSAIEFGSAFEEAKVNIVSTDISGLGRLRAVWSEAIAENPSPRKVVLSNFGDGWDMCVVDDCSPAFLRFLGTFSSEKELVREVMFSLVGIDGGIGAKNADEIVLYANFEIAEPVKSALSSLAPVRVVEKDDAYAGAEGCAMRLAEGDGIDITPATWQFSLAESRFISKAKKAMLAVGTLWTLAAAVLFGMPVAFDYMASNEKALSKKHEKAFKAVRNMKARVELVRQYSDVSNGMLEILKAVSDRLPEGITLTSYTYKRGESVKVSGEATAKNNVYDYKDALVKSGLFSNVELTGPTSDKTKTVHKFDITASFEKEENQ